MAQVNPCPNCDSSSFKMISPSGRQYHVQCRRCGNTGPGAEDDVKAVEAWNNRGKDEKEKAEARSEAKKIITNALREYEQTLNSIGATKREQFGRAMQLVRDHYNIQQTRPGR